MKIGRRRFAALLAASLASVAAVVGKKTTTASLKFVSSTTDGVLTVSTEGTRAAPSKKLVSWRLDWNDGSPPSVGVGPPPPTPSYQYAESGNYILDLQVTDNAGTMARSFLSSFITVNPPTPNPSGGGPNAPTGFSTTLISDTQVNMSWTDNSTNETGFEVHRSVDGGSFTLLATKGVNVTSHSDTTTTSGPHTYVYKVRAINGSGNSNFSNTDTETTSSGAATFDFYLSTTGTDSPNTTGDFNNPFRTFNYAKDFLSAGKSLGVRGGTYTDEWVWFGGPTGTSWATTDRILVKNYNGESVTVRPNAGGTYGFALVLRNSSGTTPDGTHYVEFNGITFDGRNCINDVVKLLPDSLPDPTGAPHHIRFRNCRITSIRNLGHTQQGILIQWGADGCELLGCEIDNVGDNNSAPNSQAVYGAAHDLIITDCYIHDVDGYGISNLNSFLGLHVNNHFIARNRVTRCGKLATSLGGINVGEGTGHQVINNLVWSCSGRGIAIAFENGTGIVVYGNAVYNCAAAGYYVDPGQTNTILRNNLGYLNSTALDDGGSGTINQNNSFSTNPQWVDPVNGDFHLTVSTPGTILNSGFYDPTYPADYDNVTRSNPPDIGPYEL